MFRAPRSPKHQDLFRQVFEHAHVALNFGELIYEKNKAIHTRMLLELEFLEKPRSRDTYNDVSLFLIPQKKSVVRMMKELRRKISEVFIHLHYFTANAHISDVEEFRTPYNHVRTISACHPDQKTHGPYQ
jgi:hypothetical protein